MPRYLRSHHIVIIGLFTIICSCLQVFAGDVSLAWNPSASDDVVGYKIYIGNSSGNYNDTITIGNQTSYTVTDLSDGTYSFAVTAFDATGNESGFSNEVSTTVGATSTTDTTPPVISSVAASGITTSGATISWTTNEASTSRVEFGTSAGYGSTTSLNSSMQTSHAQVLSGLTANTVYHYRVISQDEAGNAAVSGDDTFMTADLLDTTPPVISSVSASSITENGATIGWTTNEASTSRVEYGTTAGYGSTTSLDSSMQTSHIQVLSGLSSDMLYHYRVLSMDEEGNLALSGDHTFTTTQPVDTTPPEISSVVASGITLNGATISWTTNEASTSQVEYGTTTGYGSTTSLNTSMQTSHAQALNGLSMDTLYHYRVRSRDAEGNLAVSDDFTFRTQPDTTPPTIGSVTVSGITETEATVTWITNEPSTTQIEYGTTTEYGSTTILDDSMQTSHTQVLSGLTMGKLYHFRVMSSDAEGNLAVSDDYSFTTMNIVKNLVMPLFSNGLVSQNNELYLGMAIMNMGSDPATVYITAYDENGNVISGQNLTNPVVRSINAGEQISLVDMEIFGNILTGNHEKGWIELGSTTDQIQGLFMMFDKQRRLMDAVPLISEPLKDFVFTDIESDGKTRINLINSNADACIVTIDLVKAQGDVRNSVTDIIEGHSALIADLYTDIFADITPDSTDYLRVSASNGILPFQMIQEETADISFAYGYDISAASTKTFVPHYIYDKNCRTTLTIVNMDSTSNKSQIRLMGKDGTQIGSTRDIPVDAYSKVTIESPDFFLDPDYTEANTSVVLNKGKGHPKDNRPWKSGKQDPSTFSTEIDGFVEIVSDGIPLIGSVSYRGYNNQKFIAATPLVSDLHEKVMFNHVAFNDLYFTEISIANPWDSSASVVLDLYNNEGILVDTATVSLLPRQQLSHSLDEYFAALQGISQTGGYVTLSSNVPLAVSSLLGTNNQSALSALPGQGIE
jgi:type VI protein secretion system component Hcp